MILHGSIYKYIFLITLIQHSIHLKAQPTFYFRYYGSKCEERKFAPYDPKLQKLQHQVVTMVQEQNKKPFSMNMEYTRSPTFSGMTRCNSYLRNGVIPSRETLKLRCSQCMQFAANLVLTELCTSRVGGAIYFEECFLYYMSIEPNDDACMAP